MTVIDMLKDEAFAGRLREAMKSGEVKVEYDNLTFAPMIRFEGWEFTLELMQETL